MPKQKLLESLPIAGYDVNICLKSGKSISLSHAQVKHDNGIIHVGLIKQNNPKSYPSVDSTMELELSEIRKLSYRLLPEDSVLTLYV